MFVERSTNVYWERKIFSHQFFEDFEENISKKNKNNTINFTFWKHNPQLEKTASNFLKEGKYFKTNKDKLKDKDIVEEFF